MPPSSPARAFAGALLLALVAGALFFQGLGRYPLCDPDEARHAEVAREMATGHGLRRLFLPTLELESYREKPAGYYWLVAAAFGTLGIGEAAARGAGALAALALVLAVYAWAVPREGVEGALGAGLVAATSFGWLGLARYATLDMPLTALVVVGVLSGLAWLDRPPPRRPPLAPWIAAALGALVKGPLAFGLVFGPLVLALIVRRPRPPLAALGLGRGVAVAAAIVACLYVPVGLLDPSYLTAFAATNVRRLGAESPHAAPVYAYLLWVPALFLPWTLLAPPVLRHTGRDPARRALVLWGAVVLALLSVPRGKLPTYALSTIAPLALLVGPGLAAVVRRGPAEDQRPLLLAGGWLVTLGLGVAAVAVLVVARAYPVALAARAALAAAALAWAAATALALVRGRLRLLPALVLGAVLTLHALAVRLVVPTVAELHSDRASARLIAAAAPGPLPVIAFAARMPSLVFYLGAPVIHTDDLAVARDLFGHEDLVFLVTGHRHFAEVEGALGARAHRWYANARRALYANRPPGSS